MNTIYYYDNTRQDVDTVGCFDSRDSAQGFSARAYCSTAFLYI